MNETVALIRMISEHISAYFDEDRHYLRVQFMGSITPTIAGEFDQWVVVILKVYAQKMSTVRGMIYDFRAVTQFNPPSADAAGRAYEQGVLAAVPVAIIARDVAQAAALTVVMAVSPDDARKRIVKNEPEALLFVKSYGQDADGG